MTQVPFWKVQNVGNDFVLLHAEDVPRGTDLNFLAQQLCNRKFWIGSDGLLVLDHRDGLSLLMFNPDGSPDFCGNGLLSAANHARIQGWLDPGTPIRHGGHDVGVHICEDGRLEVDIGRASFSPESIPLVHGVQEIFQTRLPDIEGLSEVCAVNTGTPHVVAFVEDLPEDPEFFSKSRVVEHHPWFAESVSLMWARVDGPDRLTLRIWERGAGETLGCGTGTAAATICWMRVRGSGGCVDVASPGGHITCCADSIEGSISLRAAPTVVFSGFVDLSRIGN